MTEIEPAWPAIIARPAEAPEAAYSDADYTISAETAERLIASRPENTQRAYDRNWDQFERWCREAGRTACPATPQTLADYVVRLIGISLAPATIDQAVGTIRSRHRDAGYDSQPDTRGAMRLLRAYRREWADAGGRTRKATPILIDALRAMTETCDTGAPGGIRDRALLLVGFNGMCRRSELAGLDIGDIRDAGEEGMTVYIRRSKTDQSAQGAEVSIPFGQHRPTCAVRVARDWMAVLSERGMTTGPLFRPVDRHGRIGDETAAAGHQARRLSGGGVSDRVHARAALAGLADPSRYTGHSLRSGAATSAYLAGAPVSEIARHGRWSENSPVVLGYIRAVDKWKNNPMKGIGL